MEHVTVQFQRLHPDAVLPDYHSTHAAGMDLAACLATPLELPPAEIRVVPCGFAMALPPGFEAQVRPRSGLAVRHGITLPNAPGTIDADYRGEVRVPLINLGRDPFTIDPGMRIAQMIIARIARADGVEVERLDETDRGHGGFGSTGV